MPVRRGFGARQFRGAAGNHSDGSSSTRLPHCAPPLASVAAGGKELSRRESPKETADPDYFKPFRYVAIAFTSSAARPFTAAGCFAVSATPLVMSASDFPARAGAFIAGFPAASAP